MHRLERPLVYGTLFVLGWASLARTGTVHAEAPVAGNFATVTATELRIVGEDGTLLVRIGGTEAGGVITWQAPRGKPAGTLSVNPNGGQLAIYNTDMKQVLFAGTATDAPIGVVSVNEKGGGRRAALFGTAGGSGQLYNADGKVCAYLGASDLQSGLLYLTSRAGGRVVEAGQNAQGGHLMASNLDGKQTWFAGTASDNGNGIMTINRKDGVRATLLTP